MKRLLATGCTAGLAGGVAWALFAATVGRGPINDALAWEDQRSGVSGASHHEELFTRGVQEVGGAIGMILFALALGVAFAVVLGAVGPKLDAATPMAASVRFAAVGLVTVVLVPFLKYPANPPAVSDPETINERTVLYLAALALSILLTAAVWRFRRSTRLSPVARAWATTALYAAGLAVILVGLPANTDPLDAPAQILWRFRLASLGGLVVLWTVLALVTGTLLSRPLSDRTAR